VQAEDALRVSEERFSKAFYASPQALVISRLADGLIEMVNERFEQLFGWSRAEAVGKTSLQLDLFAQPAEREALVRRLAVEPSLRNYEIDIRVASGQIRQARISSELLTVRRETYLLTAIEDITAQKQAQLELEAAHRQKAEILESISDAFYSLDGQERFTYVNQRAGSLWGLDPQTLLGKKIWDVFPGGEGTESYLKIRQALADRQPAHYETYSAFLDQWVEIHLYPTEQGISIYFQDISERKKAEAAIQYSVQQLERSNRDLQDFAFVASHDLQEPLRKIQVFSERLAKDADNLSAQQQDSLSRVGSAAQRMQTMVDGLLELSRLTTHGQAFRAVDLDEVVQEALADLELAISRSQAEIEVADLPVVQADPAQMRRLFLNLIGNALKFQPPGGRPKVHVSASRPDAETVQVAVQDNGIGFDPHQADQIFQPFQRLVGRSEYEGSGLGLAICRRIVERHGGDIRARSSVGAGTTIIVTLPLKQAGAARQDRS
jgi:PAS domain S-box-containing protein